MAGAHHDALVPQSPLKTAQIRLDAVLAVWRLSRARVLRAVCSHFHSLYDEYAEICHRHGVRLNTRKDVSAAWRSA